MAQCVVEEDRVIAPASWQDLGEAVAVKAEVPQGWRETTALTVEGARSRIPLPKGQWRGLSRRRDVLELKGYGVAGESTEGGARRHPRDTRQGSWHPYGYAPHGIVLQQACLDAPSEERFQRAEVVVHANRFHRLP